MHDILQDQSLSRGELQFNISNTSNIRSVSISHLHLLIFSSSVCFKHSTFITDMTGGASIYPPTISTTNHIDFGDHSRIWLFSQVSLCIMGSSRFVPESTFL